MFRSPLAKAIVAAAIGTSAVVAQCDFEWTALSGETCAELASDFSITLAQFIAWNPSVGANCVNGIVTGDEYCVQMEPSPTTTTGPTATTLATSTISKAPTTTSTSTPVVSPTQTGIPSTCDAWYLVKSGDQCGTIATAFGITLDDFYDWNPAVGSSCGSLDVGYYVCIGLTGSSSPTTVTGPLPTPTSNGPSPQQSGIISTCDAWYFVESGNQCGTIATAFGITVDDFYDWNPAVGSSCGSLYVGYYVCVGLTGTASPTTITTPLPTPTVNGPSPQQTGIISTCDAWYFVESGNQCGTIATAFGITLDDFYDWNPAVGSSCASLDVGYYVCIGLTGTASPTTVTTPLPTPTTNGPSPQQSGIISTCDKWYKAVSGDGCQAIATTYGITLAEFYKWNPAVGTTCADLFVGYYYCVGI